MGNACRSFGFDDDEGMRIFSIVEMFIAAFHIITSSFVFQNIVEKLFPYIKEKGGHEITLLVIGSAFTLTLVLQAVFGFLLYLKGWKERNGLICYIWMGLGIANLVLSVFLVLVEVIDGRVIFWNRLFLYLFYVIFGIWVIKGFLKWAKEEGFESANVCSCSFGRSRDDDDEENGVRFKESSHGANRTHPTSSAPSHNKGRRSIVTITSETPGPSGKKIKPEHSEQTTSRSSSSKSSTKAMSDSASIGRAKRR